MTMSETGFIPGGLPVELRVHSVERAFDLLETLDRIGHPLTLTEVSRNLSIPKSSAYYLIQTLIARGYMQRIPGSRKYASGLRTFDFHGVSALEDGLKRVSAQHIRELSAALKMTVQTAVLKAGEGVIIDKAAWPIDRWGGSWVGHHFDLHCTAQGKVLIAWLTDEEVDKLFLNLKLARFNSKTITSLDKLKPHLAEIRKHGYALNDEEHILGIRAVAAPVFSHIGNVVASVSVRGSTTEIAIEYVESLSREIIRTTHMISRDFQNPATC
jgi:IclR family KDG regulon transcriptional repressor